MIKIINKKCVWREEMRIELHKFPEKDQVFQRVTEV